MLQYIVLTLLLCVYKTYAHDTFNTIDVGPPYTVGAGTEEQNIKPDIYSLHVYSTVQYRYAHTLVTSRVANRANTSKEVSFSVLLPETAFISGFLMEIDGKVYKAHVKGKEDAKREYTQAVKAGQSAGHVAQVARDSNRFSVAVNIEPQKKVTFNLTYEELLKRELSLYNLEINLNPGQIVQDLLVQVNINESSPITALKVPELRETNEIMEVEPENSIAVIEKTSDSSAVIIWAPTPEQQAESGVKGQLVVQYDVNRSSSPEQILVNEGYFVHFFAPENLTPMRKFVVFILDVSGSMSGRKIEQLREAMRTILDDLRSDDFFSLVIFSSNVQVWNLNSSTMLSVTNLDNADIALAVLQANESNVSRAKSFISTLQSQTSTNIYSALSIGLDLIQLGQTLTNVVDSQQANTMIIFLTDGQPNVGESNPKKITKYITKKNRHNNATIFSLSFGNDADFDFLKKLSLQNFGFARKIYKASDAALQLRNFYKEIASPLLSNVTFMYGKDQYEHGSLTKRLFSKFYNGSEFVIAGKLTSNTITGNLTAESASGLRTFMFEPSILVPYVHPPENHITCVNTNSTFMERLWAYLTIKQLLDKKASSSNVTAENTSKALELALQYSFVTPLTSLVVVKPNGTSYTDTERGDTHHNKRPVNSHRAYPTSIIQPLSGGHRSGFASYSDAMHTNFLNGNIGRSAIVPSRHSFHIRDRMGNGRLRQPDCIGSARPCSRELVTLTQLSWLNQTGDNQSAIYINTSVNGTSKRLQVAINKTNEAYESCMTPIRVKGHCRHLQHCSLSVFKDDYNEYINHQCIIDQIYAGVCCPDTLISTERRLKSRIFNHQIFK